MSTGIGNAALAYARVWHLVDARGQVLGRLGSQIAQTLMGKHKPIYDPSSDCGDYVVVVNARHIAVSGRKREQKMYRHHSGFPGGLKEIAFDKLQEKTPEKIIEKAVSGMLPKNRLRKVRLARLMIYPDGEHPYAENIIKRYDTKIPLVTQSID
ncbi:54S ribosomal protein L23, mitochondrial [Coemansia sp. RSA 989]|nr:50S ribosomal protein L13 [Coemansia mojavensis]KAJ1743724.1 54S ribosomal protein L23, mitochondrial [Coemansia sp. RSA 1086]KAJ1752602.1 54S ribosomal protein L23, mitochondrial [Coemansia sp. RSA 1821]KAJ1867170.1 54S ribosomal protein L23, mitochondrial [Coemansia sp. RSA 989]KAJ1874045.1 54S ribosomal protein L23, mitochondrial [Coemansia sp. RSA 990]KAJ2449509.1 54S ribosomal protein L23, mitochondrial [Coemansia sp. RSA 2336]KAJ2649063.1 54S ribosomal protein L23, mitochondrial [Coe